MGTVTIYTSVYGLNLTADSQDLRETGYLVPGKESRRDYWTGLLHTSLQYIPLKVVAGYLLDCSSFTSDVDPH